MQQPYFDPLLSRLGRIRPVHSMGQVVGLQSGSLWVTGLNRVAAIGDCVEIAGGMRAEIVRMGRTRAQVLPEGPVEGLRPGDAVRHLGPRMIAPGVHWIGRVIDPDGTPLDGRPLFPGPTPRSLRAAHGRATRHMRVRVVALDLPM